MHLEGQRKWRHLGNRQEILTGPPISQILNTAHVAVHQWRYVMDNRFVNKEFSLLKRLAGFISDLLYAKEDLQDRLKLIDNGPERLDKLLDDISELVRELLSTGPESQRRQLHNTIKDYRLEFVPALSPGTKNILMSKTQAKQLIDLAREKCRICVEDPESARKCALYQLLEVTALPDSYETLLCPYSESTWAD